jgi:hypothetical protein
MSQFVRRQLVAVLAVLSLILGFTVSSASMAGADPAPTVPDAPTSLVAYRGNTSAEIAFTAGADGGAVITNYKYSTDNGGSWTAFSPSVTTPSVTIGGLTNGTTYSVKLRAVNSAGDGAVSDAVSVTPAVTGAVTWTARTASEANSWQSVTYGNGVFVAVASDGTNRVMTSTDGVTWTARTAASAYQWVSVTYGNGLFVAVEPTGQNRVMTSPDGVTWTRRNGPGVIGWNSVTYGNGVFVAVGPNTANRVMTSPDGVTWTARTAAQSNTWNSVTYGNGVFVAVSSDGTNRVMTSTDNGVTWTARSASEVSTWRSVAYGNGVFVAVAASGTNRVMTSPDGVTWTARTADAFFLYSVTYGNGVFVAVAYAGSNRVITSPDGVTWTARTAAQANVWRSVAYGNGVFVAVSSDGTNRVMTSSLVMLATAPDAPTSLIATVGDRSASIAFTAGADGGAAITKYQYKVGSGAWTDAVGTTSPITISGLTNNVFASIRLRAVNAAGDGAASAVVKVWPRVGGPLLNSLKAQSASRILASVTALNPVGGTMSHYWFTAYTKGTSTVVTTCRATAAVRSCVFSGLLADTEYDVSARGFFTLTGSADVLQTLDSATQTVRTKS